MSKVLKTTDGFYADFSGYKVIAVQSRFFSQKQIGSYYTVASAKADWQKLKKARGYVSWADIQNAKKQGQTIKIAKSQEARPKVHVKVNLNISPESKTARINTLQETIERLSHDLVHYADLMENTERDSRERREISRDYRVTAQALKEAKDEQKQLRESMKNQQN